MRNETKNKISKFSQCLAITLSLTLFQMSHSSADNKVNEVTMTPRIVNGETSKLGAWPWMASISEVGSDWHFCGGTLIDPEWVLTAAHCVEGQSNLKVLLGQNDLKGSGGEVISVTHSIIHPNRNKETHDADIALLHLASPSSIEPVLLSSHFDFNNERGHSALAIGWGIVAQGDEKEYNSWTGKFDYPITLSPYLQEVMLKIQTNYLCDSTNIRHTICLGISEQKNICKGDSGGPLLMFDPTNQKWKQIGITSLGGAKCDHLYGVSVFTQVDKYQSFILSTINGISKSAETPEEFLMKCASKYPQYVGQVLGAVFQCDNGYCLNTSGGSLIDVVQLYIPIDNRDEILEYAIADKSNAGYGFWYKVAYSAINYCN